MKRINVILAIASLSPVFSFATVSISGTALGTDPSTGIVSGQDAVVLVDLDGSAFSVADVQQVLEGLAISDSSTYAGFSVIHNSTIDDFFGSAYWDFTIPALSLTGGIDQGDAFGILVFNSSVGTTVSDDTYSIFADPTWVLPADGSTITFGSGGYNQANSAPGATGTVVPEPSTYAALSGLLALTWVMLRRRRV